VKTEPRAWFTFSCAKNRNGGGAEPNETRHRTRLKKKSTRNDQPKAAFKAEKEKKKKPKNTVVTLAVCAQKLRGEGRPGPTSGWGQTRTKGLESPPGVGVRRVGGGDQWRSNSETFQKKKSNPVKEEGGKTTILD